MTGLSIQSTLAYVKVTKPNTFREIFKPSLWQRPYFAVTPNMDTISKCLPQALSDTDEIPAATLMYLDVTTWSCVRPVEASRITWADYHNDRILGPIVMVTGKCGKARKVPVTTRFSKLFQELKQTPHDSKSVLFDQKVSRCSKSKTLGLCSGEGKGRASQNRIALIARRDLLHRMLCAGMPLAHLEYIAGINMSRKNQRSIANKTREIFKSFKTTHPHPEYFK